MLTDIPVVTTKSYIQASDFSIKSGRNMIVFGQAGIGKTEIAWQRVNLLNYTPIYVNLSVLEAPDLQGLPTVEKTSEGPRVEYATPKFLPPATGSGPKHVLVLDEIDKARPELQNPLLELFQSKSINGRKLDVHAIVATANLPDEGAFSQPLSTALTNRSMNFKLEASFDDWQEWAAQTGLNALVVGFLNRNHDYFSRARVADDDTAYNRCSPRSWTNSARSVDDAGPGANVDFLTLIISGYVGYAAAVKFQVWLDHYRHIEPAIDKLVKHGVHPDDMAMDRQIVAAIMSCNEVAKECRKQGGDKKKHLELVHKMTNNVYNWLVTLPCNYQIIATKSTMDMELVKAFRLTSIKSFMDVFQTLGKAQSLK